MGCPCGSGGFVCVGFGISTKARSSTACCRGARPVNLTLLNEHAMSVRCSMAGTTNPMPCNGWVTSVRLKATLTMAEEAYGISCSAAARAGCRGASSWPAWRAGVPYTPHRLLDRHDRACVSTSARCLTAVPDYGRGSVDALRLQADTRLTDRRAFASPGGKTQTHHSADRSCPAWGPCCLATR